MQFAQGHHRRSCAEQYRVCRPRLERSSESWDHALDWLGGRHCLDNGWYALRCGGCLLDDRRGLRCRDSFVDGWDRHCCWVCRVDVRDGYRCSSRLPHWVGRCCCLFKLCGQDKRDSFGESEALFTLTSGVGVEE